MEYNTALKEYNRYILKIANSWSNKDSDLSKDLQQEGRVALWSAINSYDASKGNEKGYITMMIKMAMRKWLTKNLRTIRIPSHIQFAPDREEMDIEKTISLDAPINVEGESILDFIVVEEEDNSIDDHQLRTINLIKSLSKDEQYIILNYTGYLNDGDKMTYQEIANNMGVTKEAIRIRYGKIINKIKAAI